MPKRSRRKIHTAKWDRCVKDVQKSGVSRNAFAVCTKALGKAGFLKNPSGDIDAFRVDNHSPASNFPYRVKVNGQYLRTKDGGIRKFETLRRAIEAGRLQNPRKLYETPRLTGYYDGLAGNSRRPPSKYSKADKSEYLSGYDHGAMERRNRIFLERQNNPKKRRGPWPKGKVPPHLRRFLFK